MAKFKVGDRVKRVSGSCFNAEHSAGFVGDVAATDGNVLTFTNGHSGFADQYVLETPVSPIRKREVTEIVPGPYGRLEVEGSSPGKVALRINGGRLWSDFNAAELSALIDTLTPIRDHLLATTP